MPRDRNAAPAMTTPRDRKGDAPSSSAAPRTDRRAASGCLWDACEALLSSRFEAAALERALDALVTAFDCDGVALHGLGDAGLLEPWCARGAWDRSHGDLRQAMSVPLFRGEERVGALDLLAKPGQRWRPDQLSLVRTASGALGAAVGARLELERLQHAPHRDPVTGLADGRAFRHHLVEAMGKADVEGTPLGVVLVDVDLFAAINEKYGRHVGDQVLAECALVLKLALREGDVIARLSADRFAVALPDCDLAPARRLAERLRHALEEHRFPRVGRLSVSAGVAASPRDGMDPAELLASAERMLGLAKKAGRHRTAASGPTTTH
jgi:diguanylate cyclase (GGDEF)-like protein